jgi:hypothetical protein
MAKFFQFTDASIIQKEAKYTFYRPSERVIQKLKKGNLVKLIFEVQRETRDDLSKPMPSAERMWVIITERNGDRFKGTVNNDPYIIRDLKLDDVVEFEAKHIIQTDIEETEPDIVEKYSTLCIVSNKVLRGNEPIGYMERSEEPVVMENGRIDSGWVFMAGDETEEYSNDPDNLAFISIGVLLNRNDVFIDLLDAPAGSAFVWDEVLQKFIPED